jgi:hypothetical protein
MISTLQVCGALVPLLAMSRWMRTDLILAATLLFLVFASWAMLVSAQIQLHQRHVGPPPDGDPRATDPADSPPRKARVDSGSRRGFGTLGIVLGLLGSVTLLAICAW